MKKLFLAAVAVALMVSPSASGQTVSQTAKVKCIATTKAGSQCARNAATGSQYCKQHDPKSLRCGAPTKSGGQCKNLVKVAGTHCKIHS